jgi:putative oxidoreductase
MKSASGILALLGRLCLSFIFLTSAYSKMFEWNSNVQYIGTRHFTVPILVSLMIGGALVIELGGALCLISGFQARVAGLVMAIYLTAVTLIFHKYWIITNGMARATMFMHFQKNLGIIGGLLMVAALGPGAWAIGGGRGSGGSRD